MAFQDFLKDRFSSVFSSPYVSVFPVNKLSLLLKVTGSRPTCNPYLLAAHMDVVPAGDLERWQRDPFLGELVEDEGEQFVWGRGAIDDKHSLVGIMQALDILLARGERPERTLYIALGHDEEVGGHQGAGNIAQKLQQLLEENDEQLDFLLDEGMTVLEGVIPGMEEPVIYIGVVEKGWTMLELSVEGEQRHSSTPPRQSATGELCRRSPSPSLSVSLQEFWPGPWPPWSSTGARQGSVRGLSGTPWHTSLPTCPSCTSWPSQISGYSTRSCPGCSQATPVWTLSRGRPLPSPLSGRALRTMLSQARPPL